MMALRSCSGCATAVAGALRRTSGRTVTSRISATARMAVSSNAVPAGKLARFDPPAYLTDLKAENLQGWSDVIAAMCDSGVEGDPNHQYVYNDPNRPQFFNHMKTATPDSAVTKDIAWVAFPRIVKVNNPNDEARWKAADESRNVQDEYCEWAVTRNAEGKITRVTFTCEGPEYFQYLAQVQPETVLQLYQQHINPAVTMADLFSGPNGEYNPINKWNQDTTTGAMHLIMRANTLGAEVELAAASSRVRLDADGDPLTDAQDLIRCGRYGQPQRSSDPFIGSTVNTLARAGLMITINNPVALYFNSFSPANFVGPDGAPLDATKYWTWTRGEQGYHVRAVFEVPPSEGFVVGDMSITGKGKVRYGSMLADYIEIKLTGLAYGPGNPQPLQGCVTLVPNPPQVLAAVAPAAGTYKAAYSETPGMAPQARTSRFTE